MSINPETMATILRQTAEAEGFRWLVERRYLLDAADVITELQEDLDKVIAERDELWAGRRDSP